MQALMLAAGMGKRLSNYTKDNTKCMIKIDDKTLIERAIEALLEVGIDKMIIVDGYKGDNLRKYLLEESTNPKIKEMNLIFIRNDEYDKTNNIYSLFLAREYLKEDDTILLESDLIYEKKLIKKIVDSSYNNLVAVAKYKQWMDGTVIKIDECNNVIDFIEKKDFNYAEIDLYYKTVNIYKLSKDFSDKVFIPFLEGYIKVYGNNEYYELVLKIVANLTRSELKSLDIGDIKWYEIDDVQDLDIANCIFSNGKIKLNNFQKRYGGYWRFDYILDYCYLVNPYFPPIKMLDKINYFSKDLITQYPSGQKIQCLNASKMFNINEDYLVVGNGAAELINSLGCILKGKMFVPKSAFNEYFRCFKNCEFSIFDMKNYDFKYDVNEIKNQIKDNDIICLVNPDNPSGAFILEDDIYDILDLCQKNNKIVIFDESFIDFASEDVRYTLLQNDILKRYNNLIVVKSISKSYGVPGIRLGILATSSKDIINRIRNDVSIWNINSYGEYFLQIINLFKDDYMDSCKRLALERKRFSDSLNDIPGIKVYNSQANYILCYLNDYDSTLLAERMLDDNIFIKDLKTKSSFEGMNYIRIAIRTKEENDYFLDILKKILKGS